MIRRIPHSSPFLLALPTPQRFKPRPAVAQVPAPELDVSVPAKKPRAPRKPKPELLVDAPEAAAPKPRASRKKAASPAAAP